MAGHETGKLRWKRHAAETGLRRVGAGPRGWVLHNGVEEFANVYANGGDWRRPQVGWVWVARVGDGDRGLSAAPIEDADQPKSEALAYVKSQIAKTTGATP